MPLMKRMSMSEGSSCESAVTVRPVPSRTTAFACTVSSMASPPPGPGMPRIFTVARTVTTASARFVRRSRAAARSSCVCADAGSASARIAAPAARLVRLIISFLMYWLLPGRLQFDEARAHAAADVQDHMRRFARGDVCHRGLEFGDRDDRLAVNRQNDVALFELREIGPAA